VRILLSDDAELKEHQVKTITCHVCGAELNVTEDAPRTLTCPRCLTKILYRNEVSRAMMPRPVIPIERQVSGDSRVSFVLACVLAALVTVGIVLVLMTRGMSGVGGMLVLMVVLAGMAAFVLIAMPHERVQRVPSRDPYMPTWADGAILSYARPFPTKPRRGWSFAGQMAVGFLASVAALALMCGGVGTTGNRAIFLLGSLSLLSALSLFSRRTRGFAAGVAIFFLLGFTAIFLICGGYLKA
jgi:predicted RNA-binding Zn-ribbon protein involved in translation (DUF1610 family)